MSGIQGYKEKAVLLNAFFALVFNAKSSCPQDTQFLELESSDRELSEAPIIQKEIVTCCAN